MNKPKLTMPKGFKAGGIHCGIKKHDKDLALFFSSVPAKAAGVFTTNKACAAPVKLTRNVIQNGILQAVIVNSGNANAVTGQKGDHDAIEMARITAQALNIDISKIAVASTGTIGRRLPMQKIAPGIETLADKISHDTLYDAAKAIMTTDTFLKAVTKSISIGKHTITISAVAKGAGMIQPNMATMLCFICTDISINQLLLNQTLKKSVDDSFNCITVDGCMSTNDMVIIMANGEAGNRTIESVDKDFEKFQVELDTITKELALMIVKDGEGATKFVQIDVSGTHSREDAKAIAYNIANSNLLKSSFYGETLNWGRIMSAIGAVDVKTDLDYVNIHLGNIILVSNGEPAQYSAEDAESLLKQKEIHLKINFNQGREKATVWTCDLSPRYVKINME